MADTPIVSSFVFQLQQFRYWFTAPSFDSFVTLVSGWVLVLRRHTVTRVVQAAGAVGQKHISSFHRFFSRAPWAGDGIGLTLLTLVMKHCPEGRPIILVVDDTLGRHTGKRIAAASMHRDPLLSCAGRPFWHWGHLWVVVSVAVPAFGKTWSLPVMVRLYRSKKRCAAESREYRTCQQLAAEMLRLLAEVLANHRIIIVGDAAYSNSSLIKNRPANVTLVGRARLDAAIYEPPPVRRPGEKGRPRVRGARLPSPQEQAAADDAPWQRFEIEVYGKVATVQVLVIDALWYVAAGSELVRLVLVRGFPGHDHDDVFVATDPTMSAQQIIETFALRWSLEVTFHFAKGKLGFEDPQNRTELAVERTAPMALWLYTLVVVWFLDHGRHLRAARVQALPWYPKGPPTFSDMLATLRRASWSEGLSDPQAKHCDPEKRLGSLLEYLDACA